MNSLRPVSASHHSRFEDRGIPLRSTLATVVFLHCVFADHIPEGFVEEEFVKHAGHENAATQCLYLEANTRLALKSLEYALTLNEKLVQNPVAITEFRRAKENFRQRSMNCEVTLGNGNMECKQKNDNQLLARKMEIILQHQKDPTMKHSLQSCYNITRQFQELSRQRNCPYPQAQNPRSTRAERR